MLQGLNTDYLCEHNAIPRPRRGAAKDSDGEQSTIVLGWWERIVNGSMA